MQAKIDQTRSIRWERLLHDDNVNFFVLTTFSPFLCYNTDDKNERYNELILQAKDHISKAKEHISKSEVKLALQAYQEAAQIKPSDKLTKKINKCQVSWS